jgi:serine protease Do
MKPTLSQIIPIAGFVLAMPVLSLEASEAAAPKQEVKREIRVVTKDAADASGMPEMHRRMKFIHAGGPAELEQVAFLGVQTAPADPALAAQLGLPRNTGLVVTDVVADSPAASVLKVHDVLVKLDDQLLIEPHQFSVLVRNHQKGDEVTLTYLRAGKEATAKVKLGQHEVPKMTAFNVRTGSPAGGAMTWTSSHAPVAREEVDRVLGLIDLGKDGAPHIVRHNQLAGDRVISVTVNTGDSNMNFSDDKGSLELLIKDGKKELVAKDPKGATIFSGPINTPEERKGLPADVADRLKKIENMQGFSFKTGEDFEGGEVKVVRPLGQGISLPVPATAPQAERPLRAL